MFSTPLKNRTDYHNQFYSGYQNNSNILSNDSNSTLNQLTSAKDVVNGTNTINGTDNFVTASSALPIANSTTSLATTGSISTNLSMVNEHVRVTGLGNTNPLELATKYIDHLYRKDSNMPVLDERSYYNNGLNYNFTKEVGGLGALTPFEREKVVNIPDEILHEAAKTEIKSDIGIFPELERCWVTIDNKLILWNINNPKDCQSIEEIKHTILNVTLVKPKPNTFVDEIKHLLLVSTPFDIYILALSFKKETDEINVFNTGMNVSINGMGTLEMVSHENTGRIFFASKSNGMNIWELQYTGSDDWFNSKCNKACLTQSTWSNLLPNNIMSMIPGAQSLFEESSQEKIIQLTVDQSRGIIYSLSSRSNIRAYLIVGKGLEGPSTIEPTYISRIIGTTTARGAAILGKKYLKISKIISVSQNENNNLFLVALTVGGVRLYFNGSIGRSSIEAIRLESIKFPPSSVTPEVYQQEYQKTQLENQKKNLPFYASMSYSESVLLKVQKKSAVLLETTTASTIISPGIFFSALVKNPPAPKAQHMPSMTTATTPSATTKGNTTTTESMAALQHRLFVTVPDYGILKNSGKYVENATFLDTTGPVKEIVPLTPLFNATNKPIGYANAYATQYSVENLRVAVLTNTSVEIYKYRTPDEVFESLIDNPLPFVLNYGLTEACSSALFVTCKFNKSDIIRSSALTFLTVGIPGVIDIKPKYNKYTTSTMSSLLTNRTLTTPQDRSYGNTGNASNLNLDDVVLSPRFYGIALLITRLFRDIWEKNIFTANNDNKVDFAQKLLNVVIPEKSVISGISISKGDIEYYLSSISILNEFFANYGDSLTRFTAPLTGVDKYANKTEEIANQAENIAMDALIKFGDSIKEALSFLNVLYEESEVDGFDQQYLAFENIFNFLKTDVQTNLSALKFKDIFAPNEGTKSSIREILLSVINRNINRGASIESTATTLQERCGSFCSTNDILSFRALEHLRKAKEIGSRDYDTLCYHLDSAIKLFESVVDDLSLNKLNEAVSIMLELNYYPKTIKFLLNIAGSVDKGNLAYQYIANGSLPNDERKAYYDKRIVIYELIFETLVKVDNLASKSNDVTNDSLLALNDVNAIKDESYSIALRYDDELFHYHLYDWLVAEKSEDKLLELDTNYILPYLNEKSKDSLKITNLLWVYHSRRSNFYKAAEILYSLAISNFDIKLHDRIECLSRANGFCNSDCPPSQNQNMVQLSSTIQELFDITGVQDDTLMLVKTDNRIDLATKDELVNHLEEKILPVSELFNDYAVPLGYHEVALNIFKISDFRDHDEIMAKWEELFESLKKELDPSGKMQDSINFINLLSSVVTKVGRKIHTSEFVFPIGELFPKICGLFYENLPAEHIKPGSIISIFLSAQVSYNKLYYILKDLIETTSSLNTLFNQEMTWLIKDWYKSDRKLRDVIAYDDIANLDNYSIDNDPIEKYHKRTGNNV